MTQIDRIGTKAYIATLNGATKHFKYCINCAYVTKVMMINKKGDRNSEVKLNGGQLKYLQFDTSKLNEKCKE